MNQFTRVRPQKVESPDGTVVQVRDREHVELIDPARNHFVVEVEFCFGPTRLYRASLSPHTADAAAVIALIVAGLEAMGGRVEVE